MKSKFKVLLTDFNLKFGSGNVEEDEKDKKSVKFAYITFRQMDALDHIRNAYRVGKCERKCTMWFGDICCSAKKTELKKKHFFKEWPDVHVACEPDNIKWENLGYSEISTTIRKTIVWLVAICLVIASLSCLRFSSYYF